MKHVQTHVSILVQGELSDGSEGVLLVRPDVGQVEHIDSLLLPCLFGLLLGHDLDLKGPRWEVSLLDGLVEILLSIVVRPVRQPVH